MLSTVHGPTQPWPSPHHPWPPLTLHSLRRRFSFYGLIPSNVPLMATSSAVYIASRAAVSATLAGAAGAAAAAGLDGALRRHIDHRPALDGAMAGLVAISAGGWWGVSGVESEGPCGAVPEGEGWEPGLWVGGGARASAEVEHSGLPQRPDF
jgi:hypothetical protein